MTRWIAIGVLSGCAALAQLAHSQSLVPPQLVKTPLVDLNHPNDQVLSGTVAPTGVPAADANTPPEAAGVNSTEGTGTQPTGPGTAPQPETISTQDETPYINIGVSGTDPRTGLSPLPGGESLAEIAAQNRAHARPPVRSITNGDVETTPSSAPAGTPTAPATAPNPDQSSVRDLTPEASAQSASRPAPTEMAMAQPPSPEPQQAADNHARSSPAPAGETANGSGPLPGTGSNLPALAILGASGAATGLLLRLARRRGRRSL